MGKAITERIDSSGNTFNNAVSESRGIRLGSSGRVKKSMMSELTRTVLDDDEEERSTEHRIEIAVDTLGRFLSSMMERVERKSLKEEKRWR